VNVDFGTVMSCIGKSSETVSNDITNLLQEIAKIQQALTVDFVSVLDTRLKSVARSSRKSMAFIYKRSCPFATGLATKMKSRVREIGTGTDHREPVEASCQTDLTLVSERKPKGLSCWGCITASGQTSSASKKTEEMSNKQSKKKAAARGVFGDTENMNLKARRALIRLQYNVQDCYHETGITQKIAKHPMFDNVTLAMILLNACWMALDLDLNEADMLYEADPIFQVVENLFCTYFSCELLIRFSAFKLKSSSLRDFWFMFDSVLVLLMVLETWVLTIYMMSSNPKSSSDLSKVAILRLVMVVKMLRLSRMARLLRSVPELVSLIKGIKAASRPVVVFFVMWIIIVYIYAFVFRQLSPPDSMYFSSMPEAINSLLLNGLLPDHAVLVNNATRENWVFWPLMLTFVSLAVLTLMNMLVVVLVEVVGALAVTEKEGMTVSYLSGELRRIFEDRQLDAEMALTQLEFKKLVVDPDAAFVIESVGVDVAQLVDMAHNLFEDLSKAGEIGFSFECLVELILNMPGTNPAKVKDMKEQLKVIKAIMKETQRAADELMRIKDELREIRQAHTVHESALSHPESDDDEDDDVAPDVASG